MSLASLQGLTQLRLLCLRDTRDAGWMAALKIKGLACIWGETGRAAGIYRLLHASWQTQAGPAMCTGVSEQQGGKVPQMSQTFPASLYIGACLNTMIFILRY